MIVSRLSCFLSGSKTTRLLKQGEPGHTTSIVPVSWIAKPWAGSPRWGRFRVPPYLGVWAAAGVSVIPTRPASARPPTMTTTRQFLMFASPLLGENTPDTSVGFGNRPDYTRTGPDPQP